MKTKIKIYLGVGIIIITLLVFVGYFFTIPMLSWEPNRIEVVASQGEEEVVIVNFSSKKDLKKTEIWITPELKPYIDISQINFETINKNTPHTLILVFSIPFDASLANYKGTLSIRNTEKNSKIYSKTLPINLEIISAGMPTPEETLSSAAKAIEDGDIKGP